MYKSIPIIFILFYSYAHAYDTGCPTQVTGMSSTKSFAENMKIRAAVEDCYKHINNPNPVHQPTMPNYSEDDMNLMRNGIWRDGATNLMWFRCPNDSSWTGQCSGGHSNTWTNSMKTVQHLNETSFLGYSDWRMATQQELQSLGHALRQQQNNDFGELSVNHPINKKYLHLLQDNYVYLVDRTNSHAATNPDTYWAANPPTSNSYNPSLKNCAVVSLASWQYGEILPFPHSGSERDMRIQSQTCKEYYSYRIVRGGNDTGIFSRSLQAVNTKGFELSDQEEMRKTTAAAQVVASQLNDVKGKVAGGLAADIPSIQSSFLDANGQIRKYGIMKRNGASLAELCVQSNIVKNIFLNHGDETDYHSWNIVSNTNCNLAISNPSL
ncbi:MAG: DUF1566 domain-containing protein [Gammaproteobacteria bacterium]|nr:DUF1566 domain-containing protein [Gammaproteobacteria bacterium]